MRLKLNVVITFLTLMVGFSTLGAGSRYSQFVVPFPSDRAFDYRFDSSKNSVIIEIKNTNPDELEPLYNYDDRLVRRLIVKEKSNRHTLVEIVLKDKNIKAAIYSFKEPFRIVIDLYDKDYRENNDPYTTKTDASSTDTSVEQQVLATQNHPRSKMKMVNKQEPILIPTRKADTSNLERKRRLLQPKPRDIKSSSQLVSALEKAPNGSGPKWKTYPHYIYKVQTNSLKSGKNYKSWLEHNAGKAMQSGSEMAEYAAKLYNFGHDHKALLAYQIVLHESPLVFDKDAKHIWNLAEIHFGKGNNTLADGYYQSLIDKHPDSPYTKYARLRKLDIIAIGAESKSESKIFSKLSKKLDSLNSTSMPELASLIAIRKSYWDQTPEQLQQHFRDPFKIPVPSEEARNQLQNSIDRAESPRTAFLQWTILLNHMLEKKKWDSNTAKFAGSYFERFKGPSTEPHRSYLQNKMKGNIGQNILKKANDDNSLQAINTLEALPVSLEKKTMSRDLAWGIAESYRKVNQSEKSIPYYEQVFKLSKTPKEKFEAKILEIDALKKSIDIAKTSRNNIKRKKFQKQLVRYDAQLTKIWKTLDENSKFEISKQYKDLLEQNLTDSSKAKTYDEITLWSWSQSIDGSKGSGNWNASYKTSDQTIFTLSNLSRQFLRMGNRKGYKDSKALLKKLDPESFNNPKAEKLWAKELTELAEIHRENNNYLEAGRVYALTGEKSKNWDKRAEALYKGGLLLYRSGRRDEAINAFEKAANDSNNLLYAELARKRLQQLQE